MSGPCGWTVTGCSCSGSDWADFEAATQTRAEVLAAHFMWAATGRRYGLCEVVWMPCNPPAPDPLYQTFGLYDAGIAATAALPGGGGGCSGDCCTSGCAVTLPGPVGEVTEVQVAGDVVDDSLYQLRGDLLVRVDGSCWPTCNRPDATVPGFQVTYTRGTEIPDAIQYATEGLACEMAKACAGQADCALPPRMQSLTRQGITIDMATEEATSQGGRLRTGVDWIDRVIDADNPAGLTCPPMVMSPDASDW